MMFKPIAALTVAAGAVAIALAPVAQAAEPAIQPSAHQQIEPAPMTCTTTRVSSMCVSPGNAQINDAPPFVNNFPMYGYFPWIL